MPSPLFSRLDALPSLSAEERLLFASVEALAKDEIAPRAAGSSRWMPTGRSAGRSPKTPCSANRYGHPHPAVVARVEARGVPFYRTDRDGAVVRLRVRREDGAELEAVAVGVEVPSVGDGVAVDVDPDGVVEVPVWRSDDDGRG